MGILLAAYDAAAPPHLEGGDGGVVDVERWGPQAHSSMRSPCTQL